MLVFLCASFTCVTNLPSLHETFCDDRFQWLCMALWYHLLAHRAETNEFVYYNPWQARVQRLNLYGTKLSTKFNIAAYLECTTEGLIISP